MYSCTLCYVHFFMSTLTFCPPLKKKNKWENSQLSFPRMPPSLWWFPFNPCLSICSSPDLSASYILPPGFSHHLKQSLKIWLQKKNKKNNRDWEHAETLACVVSSGIFPARYRISFLLDCYVSICFFCWKLPWTKKKQNSLFVCFSAHMCIVLEENATFTFSFRDH